jgi:hypothetical protein
MEEDVSRDNTGKFAPKGKEPLAAQSLTVRLPESLDEVVRAMPNRSEWLREAIVRQAIEQGIWEEM